MRKFILISAMVLASATAQAGGSRGLTMASADEPAAVEPSKTQDAPAYVARPAAIDTKTEQPSSEQPKADQAKVDPPKPAPEKTADAPKAEKPKKRHESTEARVIYELHRHGIYW
jgi:outer membrane biosynthesis protein TonB